MNIVPLDSSLVTAKQECSQSSVTILKHAAARRSVGMHFTENFLKLDTQKSLLRLFSIMFWGRQKIWAISDKQNFNSCYTSHCEVMISKWACYSLQEQCLLTLSMYSSLKFNFSKLYMYGRCRWGIVPQQIFCLEIANTHPQGCTNLEQSEQGRSSPSNCSDAGCFQEMQTIL